MKHLSRFSLSFYTILACFLWSTPFLVIKIGFQYTKPLSFAGYRFIFAGVMLLPFCGKFSDFIQTVRLNYRTIAGVCFFQTFLLYTFFYNGMALVPASAGAMINGSSPLFAAVAAHIAFHDDKLNFRKIISILIGISGVVIISLSKNSAGGSHSVNIIGIVLIILGCIASAIGNVIVAKDKDNINPLVLNATQIFIGGILLLILSIPVEGMPKIVYPLPYYIALFWLSAVSAIAFSLWFFLLKSPGVKISDLNVWRFIIPVSGAILSWIFLPSESPNIYSIIGMICIALAIVSYNLFVRIW